MVDGWPIDGRWLVDGWPMDGRWMADGVGSAARCEILWGERGGSAYVRVAGCVSSGVRGGAVSVSYDGRVMCGEEPVDGR